MGTPQFAPASSFAQRFGVKALIYGPPGAGKTRLVATAPRPLYIGVEPGMASMRDLTYVTACQALTAPALDDIFAWLKSSAEARNYDTIYIDSASQVATVILDEELSKKSSSGKKVDGKAAYGEMAQRVMVYMNQLYYTPEKNIVLIAQELDADSYKKPYFPGKDLMTKVPHQYDEILRLAPYDFPGTGAVTALRTKGDFNMMARDKLGKLGEYEYPDLTQLFTKLLTV